MSDFPGYTEITCPCCNRYKHVRNEKVVTLKDREYKDGYTGEDIGRNIVCGDCWKVVEFFVNKEFERTQQ